MRIISLAPGSITGMSLDGACWRIGLGARSTDQGHWLTLRGIYPPSGVMAPADAVVTLAQVQVSVAQQVSDVARVASVALLGGTPELDRARMDEAFSLFKNNHRVKEDELASCLDQARQLLTAYWRIREWIGGTLMARDEIVLPDDTKLLLLP